MYKNGPIWLKIEENNQRKVLKKSGNREAGKLRPKFEKAEFCQIFHDFALTLVRPGDFFQQPCPRGGGGIHPTFKNTLNFF